MENLDLYLKNITAKDENAAQQAVCYMIDNSDVTLFKMLVDKTEFLYDFVRDNVFNRIEKAVNHDNFMNILKFFKVYSSFYDDLFASILSKHANENLTDIIFDMLEKGSIDEKTYAAKYFSYIPDTVALELLSKYAFDDDENLSFNSAQALGQMQDDISFDIALSYLESNDDFEKLKAVKYFTAYGRNYPLKEIFAAMNTSKMPENIAGQIPYMQSIVELFNSAEYRENALDVLDNIISGLGEILPLFDIFQFEIFEIIQILINNNKSDNVYASKIAKVLLKAYSRFKLFTENQEYVFDLEKEVKYEINSVMKLLKTQTAEFWNNQKSFVIKDITLNNRLLTVFPVISEYNIKEAIPDIRGIISSNSDEVIICEALSTLKSLGALTTDDVQSALPKIENPNIKAIINSL